MRRGVQRKGWGETGEGSSMEKTKLFWLNPEQKSYEGGGARDRCPPLCTPLCKQYRNARNLNGMHQASSNQEDIM